MTFRLLLVLISMAFFCTSEAQKLKPRDITIRTKNGNHLFCLNETTWFCPDNNGTYYIDQFGRFKRKESPIWNLSLVSISDDKLGIYGQQYKNFHNELTVKIMKDKNDYEVPVLLFKQGLKLFLQNGDVKKCLH